MFEAIELVGIGCLPHLMCDTLNRIKNLLPFCPASTLRVSSRHETVDFCFQRVLPSAILAA